MKKSLVHILCLFSIVCLTACEKYETYADMKAKEQDAISRFISKQGIQVIDEATFFAQGQTTDITENQYVKFERNGVYMQIVRKGCGDKLEEDKYVVLLCRFMEQNLLTDSVLVRAFSSWFIDLAQQPRQLRFYIDGISEDLTAITPATTNPIPLKSDDRIFDLQGRLMGNQQSILPKGIYVRNGRKFIIK